MRVVYRFVLSVVPIIVGCTLRTKCEMPASTLQSLCHIERSVSLRMTVFQWEQGVWFVLVCDGQRQWGACVVYTRRALGDSNLLKSVHSWGAEARGNTSTRDACFETLALSRSSQNHGLT
eukprot:3133572-Amphidinium_carterae.1